LLELYAARTIAVPPVATIVPTRLSAINDSTSGTVGFSTHCTMPAGAPAASAASASVRAAAAQTSFAKGCGLITTALRVIRARMVLK
jgi:hypothetical protein